MAAAQGRRRHHRHRRRWTRSLRVARVGNTTHSALRIIII